jgi:hypothetical protein
MARQAARRSDNARASAQAAEREERELNEAVNNAIVSTEGEVFADAMGSEALDRDSDTDLEEMGEGLEGDDLGEEAEGEAEEGEESDAEGEGEEGADAQGEEGQGEEGEAVEAQGEEGEPTDRRPRSRDQRGGEREEGYIPPRVLRDANERRRSAEERIESERAEWRAEMRAMQQRLDNVLTQRQPAAQSQQGTTQQTQPAAEPDMFADPEGWKRWNREQVAREADERVNARFGAFEQRQREDAEARFNTSLDTAFGSPRGFEYRTAYRDLTTLDKTPQNAALVRQIFTSANPAQAIMDWWQETSNPEYIDYVRDTIRRTYASDERGPRRGSNGNGQRRGDYDDRQDRGFSREQREPRREFRLPRSLNSAAGGGSQRISDPEMLDGSEGSVFSFGARR